MEDQKLLDERKKVIMRLIEIKTKEDLKKIMEPDPAKLIPPVVLGKDIFLVTNLKVLTYVDGSQFRNLLMNIVFDGYLQKALVTEKSSTGEPHDVYLYLEELIQFCVAGIGSSEELKKKIHDLLFGKLFLLCLESETIEGITKYQFYRAVQLYQSSPEEEWKVLECLLPIAKDLRKLEEVLDILKKMREMASTDRDIVIRCNYDILKVYETIRESQVSEEAKKDYDDMIVKLVLEFTSQKDLLSTDDQMKLLRKYSLRYRNHKDLQNLVPEQDASQNYFRAGLEILKKGGNLEEADALFNESIRKDPMNLFAHEGKREILKKKIHSKLEEEDDDDEDDDDEETSENKKKLCYLCYKMYEQFDETLDRKKKIDLMNDVLKYHPSIGKKKEEEERADLSHMRLRAIHNRDVMLLRTEHDVSERDRKKEKAMTDNKIEMILKKLEMMERDNHDLRLQTESLKLTVLKLSRNKSDRAQVLLETRNSLQKFFTLCGVRWELRMKRKSDDRLVDIWLFHDVKHRSVSLASDSKVELFQCVGGLVKKKGELVSSVRLSANITEEDGWKIFDDVNLNNFMMFEVSITISHDVGTR